MSVTTRFAPSPTGRLHPGNLRTALLNWLLARKEGGRFLLRFEDTDEVRNQQPYVAAIEETLRWLGLEWDGPTRFQSRNRQAHLQTLRQLAECGAAYRCFCTPARLQADRRIATARGLPPRYSGRCRALGRAEAEARAEKESFVWRLALHSDDPDAVVVVPDRLRGAIRFSRCDLDDPVVVRSDGSFTFLLPNAVDDACEGITHVVRGDDHLTNSACQVWLLQLLGRPVPCYFHHGLLLDADGAKLSKRFGAITAEDLRAAGLLPQALVQTLARLGHPNIDEQIHDLAGLARAFRPEALSTTAVRWSDELLWRWHTRLLRALPAEELAGRIAPFLPPCAKGRLVRLAELIAPNLERAEDAARYARLIDAHAAPDAEATALLQGCDPTLFRTARTLWRECADGEWRSWTRRLGEACGIRGRRLFMPLRAALSGSCHGPEMGAIIAFLGRDGVAARLDPDTLPQRDG
ncbi:MAG: glutamate--tRNA ligase [Zetaproteobacteria bacterium]|nr:MAG: glutamate--tRNA ligase [Zetaproteobacteria bacterium]